MHAAFVVLDSAVPHVQAGNSGCSPCATRAATRSFRSAFTLESYPGLAYDSLFGLVGPARMPPELVQQLSPTSAACWASRPCASNWSASPWTSGHTPPSSPRCCARDRALAQRREGIRRPGELKRMTPRLRIALVLFCLAVLALLAAQVPGTAPCWSWTRK